MSNNWQIYSNDIITSSYQLNQVERHFGYGGFIHQFKNLILRKDKSLIPTIEQSLEQSIKFLDEFKQSELGKEFLSDVNDIRGTFLNYQKNLNSIKSVIDNNDMSPEAIDGRVKVDDRSALIALQTIVIAIDKKRALYQSEIDIIESELLFYTQLLHISAPVVMTSLIALIIVSFRLRFLQAKFRSLFEYSPNAIIEVDEQGKVVKSNNHAQEVFGYSQNELHGLAVEELLPKNMRSYHVKLREKFNTTVLGRSMAANRPQLFAMRKNESLFPVEITLSPFETRKNNRHVLAEITDTSEKYDLQNKVSYDHLTRLYNRFAFEERLSKEIVKASTIEYKFSLMLIDIDHFKRVNDKFGHVTGDKVLMQFSDLLHKSSRKIDFVGRWGGEEFVVLCPESNKVDTLKQAERLHNKLTQYQFEDVGFITCSVGATVFLAGDTLLTIMQRVDDALYTAKNQGRNQTIFSDTN